ncbi:hypothetical protein [Pectobacterium aroidearum]|uniref:hypothetical protein n=1 Tax=Pectobacterium aroidearum TaxID=1201031 RepID=UPI0032ECE2C5
MTMLRTTLSGLFILLICLFSFARVAAAETPRPPIATLIKAYEGTEGAQVWTLRIGEPADSTALVQITGIDHEWNTKIQKMNVEKQASGTRYWLEVDHKKFVVLIMNQGYGELYLPGEAQPVRIGYSKSLSEQGNPERFLTDYLQQSSTSQ